MRTIRTALSARVGAFLLVLALLPAAVQAACTYTVAPSGRSHGYGMATNTIQVSAATGCAWSVTNANPWITIQSGTSGTSKIGRAHV